MSTVRRLRIAAAAVVAVIAAGTVGYVAFGFGWVDALYQTVTTVTTVGFREVEPFGPAEQFFTMALILCGVGTVLYAFGVVLEAIVEGRVLAVLGRRRMERELASLNGHTIICGWGRVGRTIAQYSAGVGEPIVVIDRDAERLASCPHPYVVGDATDDDVLDAAGVARARAVVAAVEADADNLFIVVSGRALRPELFIVARVRSEANEPKMRRAGADRVVNPQRIGGARMAAFVVHPHVAEFLDVVMHDGTLEFRLAEVVVGAASPHTGATLRESRLREATGALVLAVREHDGTFRTNPPPDTRLTPGEVLIAVGTADQLDALTKELA